jgi:outer membrane receptor protein involved in Fe transport
MPAAVPPVTGAAPSSIELLPTVEGGAVPLASPEEAEVELVSEPTDSGEMVVTARRRKENIQSVPVAVTALSEKQLESSAIRDVSDLNGAAPGFTANQGGSQVTPGALSTAIRGIGIIEVEKSYELPVGTMIDGIILGNAVGSNVANFDLEAVEILRGAQGTLFGRNATAGLVALRTPIRPATSTLHSVLSGTTSSPWTGGCLLTSRTSQTTSSSSARRTWASARARSSAGRAPGASSCKRATTSARRLVPW